jgi:hypothetical protein
MPARTFSSQAIPSSPTPVLKQSFGHIPNLTPDAMQPAIPLAGTSECPLVHFELKASDYFTADRRPPELQGPGSPLGIIDTSITQVPLPSID